MSYNSFKGKLHPVKYFWYGFPCSREMITQDKARRDGREL